MSFVPGDGFVAGLVGFLVIAAGLVWGSVRVWQRRAALSVTGKVVAWVSVLATAWGVLGTAWGILGVLGAATGESVDPSQSAHILAEDISMAMSCAVMGALASTVGVVTLLFLTRKATPA